MSNLIVQKYGGTSLGSIERIQAVAKHIADYRSHDRQLVVVVSAMGHETDRLVALAKQVHPSPPQREMDMLLTAGERISMALVAMALSRLGVTCRSFTGSQVGILTDQTHGNARIQSILGDRIRQGLQAGHVTIVAGFQGVDPTNKEVTTLGRGGSDLTAVALAAALKAQTCEIYTDVDGVYVTDPRLLPWAPMHQQLSWPAMCRLAWAGAGVVHHRAANVARRQQVALEIRSSFLPSKAGTLIKGTAKMESAVVEGIVPKKNLELLRFSLSAEGTKSPPSGLLSWLWQRGEHPQLARRSFSRNSFFYEQLVSADVVDDYLSFLQNLASEQGSTFALLERQASMACITIVGSGFWENPEVVDNLLTASPTCPIVIDLTSDILQICLPGTEVAASLTAIAHAAKSQGLLAQA